MNEFLSSLSFFSFSAVVSVPSSVENEKNHFPFSAFFSRKHLEKREEFFEKKSTNTSVSMLFLFWNFLLFIFTVHSCLFLLVQR